MQNVYVRDRFQRRQRGGAKVSYQKIMNVNRGWFLLIAFFVHFNYI